MAHKSIVRELEVSKLEGLFACDVCRSLHESKAAALKHESRIHGLHKAKRKKSARKAKIVDWSSADE